MGKQAKTEKRLEDVERTAANADRAFTSKLKEVSLKRAETEGKYQKAQAKLRVARILHEADKRLLENATLNMKLKVDEERERRRNAELRTFRVAIRGAVRGGTGIVQRDGTVEKHLIR